MSSSNTTIPPSSLSSWQSCPVPHIHLLCMHERFSDAFVKAASAPLSSSSPSSSRDGSDESSPQPSLPSQVSYTIHNCSLTLMPPDTQFDLIVSPANSYGLLDGGFDDAISRAFSPRGKYYALTEYVQQVLWHRWRGHLPVGSAEIIRLPDSWSGLVDDDDDGEDVSGDDEKVDDSEEIEGFVLKNRGESIPWREEDATFIDIPNTVAETEAAALEGSLVSVPPSSSPSRPSVATAAAAAAAASPDTNRVRTKTTEDTVSSTISSETSPTKTSTASAPAPASIPTTQPQTMPGSWHPSFNRPNKIPNKNTWSCHSIAMCPTMRVPDLATWNREVVYSCTWSLLCAIDRHNRFVFAQQSSSHESTPPPSQSEREREGKRIRPEKLITSILLVPLGTGVGQITPERWAEQSVLAIQHFLQAASASAPASASTTGTDTSSGSGNKTGNKWMNLKWDEVEEIDGEIRRTWE